MREITPIKLDWVNRRCSPAVMPFAGIINAPPGTSKFAFAGRNFTNCISTILKGILGEVLKPIYAIAHLIIKMVDELKDAEQKIREVLDSVRTSSQNMTERILNRMLNSITPVILVILKTKDSMYKTGGVLTQVLMMILSVYYTLKSAIGAFLELLIISIIVLVAAMVVFWTDPFTWPMAIIATIIFAFLAVMCAIIAYWMNYILDLTESQSTPTSSCFDEDTVIATKSGGKYISDIEPGDVLADGSKVTALFKLSSCNEDMYRYGNIVVSGTHKLMTPLGRCVSVSSHPNSVYIENYCKPYLYCLSTTSKVINIDGIIFSDWDEVDDFDWENIKERARAYLPEHPQRQHIHEFLESGLGGKTNIELLDGNCYELKDIQINDYLCNGEKVLGIVRINTDNVIVKKYNIKGNFITCSSTVPFVDDNLGNTTTSKMQGVPISCKDDLYHLITDTKFFTIGNVKFHDYNGVIEEIMEGPTFLFPSF